MKRLHLLLAIAGCGALVGSTVLMTRKSNAADHLDPPGRTDPDPAKAGAAADREADIADVFTWHRGTGASQTVVLALTFSGPNEPAAVTKLKCDKDVLYTIHVSSNDNGVADSKINARFAKDSKENCFVRFDFDGITGYSPMVLRTEAVNDITAGNIGKYYAGLRDDAFFFDLQGFRETFMDGKVKMISDRDFFKGKNTPAIAIELPAAALSKGKSALRVWATTARKKGAM
jgi:Domain of unknown function (DUF4331)